MPLTSSKYAFVSLQSGRRIKCLAINKVEDIADLRKKYTIMGKENLKILVDGKEYPCRQTMGAMLRFKQETGKEVTDIGAGSLTELCTFLWCCVVSACKSDGVEFGLSLMEFADSIGPDELQAWGDDTAAGAQDGGEEKKTA